MKKVTVKNLAGIQTHGAQIEDPTAWIAEAVAGNWWGLPERPELDEMGQPTGVMLPAEYTVSIEDITSEYNLQQVIAARKAEYPSAEEFMNAFFDGGEEAIAALQAKRLEIKAKYPKN
jgi:hypothetical protein